MTRHRLETMDLETSPGPFSPKLRLRAAAIAVGLLMLATGAGTERALARDGLPTGAGRGLFTWTGMNVVPTGVVSPDRYLRFSWAALEPRSGRYDFSPIDAALASLPPGGRLSFGVHALNPCCSRFDGVDLPRDLADGMSKGFWLEADAGTIFGHRRIFVPDWNDPAFIEQFTRLFAALGARYDHDERIGRIDVRGYGSWGEGHLAGVARYKNGVIPYDDPMMNRHGALPGTLATRIALAEAVVRAFPHRQLLAMTDDTEVMLHLLRLPTAIPIGLRRDSWGSRHFEVDLLPAGVSEADRALVGERWKTAPVVVEAIGGALSFEVGPEGIVRQIEDHHVAAIGNGNFGDNRWDGLTGEQQQALLKAADRSGYRHDLIEARIARSEACDGALEARFIWCNSGVAPTYEDWVVEFVDAERRGRGEVGVVAVADLPRLMPGDEGHSGPSCLPGVGRADRVLVRVVGRHDRARAMALPIEGSDPLRGYPIPHACVDGERLEPGRRCRKR